MKTTDALLAPDYEDPFIAIKTKDRKPNSSHTIRTVNPADVFYALVNGDEATVSATATTESLSFDNILSPLVDCLDDDVSSVSASDSSKFEEEDQLNAILDASSFTRLSSFARFDMLPHIEPGTSKGSRGKQLEPCDFRRKVAKPCDSKNTLCKLQEGEGIPFEFLIIPMDHLDHDKKSSNNDTDTIVSDISTPLTGPTPTYAVKQKVDSSGARWNNFKNGSKSASADGSKNEWSLPKPSRISPPSKPLRQISADSRPREKSVAFSTVHVRFYECVLEANPAVTSGIALGVGWVYKRGKSLSVNEWERQKIGLQRRGCDLLVPRHVREQRVLEVGYSQDDIAQATREILRSKEQRKRTVENLPVQKYEEALETTMRRIKRFLSIGGGR